MNNHLVRWSSGVMAAVLLGLAIHTPATIWLGTMLGDGLDIMIKAWKELLMVLVMLPVGWLVFRQPKLRHKLQNDLLVQIIAAYALLHFVLLPIFWQGWLSSIAGLMIDLRYLLAFTLVYVLVLAYPAARRWLIGALAVGAVIIIGFATLQHALPHDFLKHLGYGPDTVVPYLTIDQNYDFIRLSSTMRGPNPMGAYATSLVIVLMALMWGDWQKRRQVRASWLVLAVLATIALWFSYSRSANMALVVGFVVLLLVLKPWQQVSRRALIASMVAGGLMIGLATVTLWQSSFFSNVVLHTNPENGSETQSNVEHWQSLGDGIARMTTRPLGEGVGSTGSASLFGDQPVIIENQYLFIAHEVGWFGLIFFAVIVSIVLLRLYRLSSINPWATGVLASGVGLCLIGLVLPVWVDDVVSIVWWSLAAVVLAAEASYTKKYDKPKTRHQKTTRAT